MAGRTFVIVGASLTGATAAATLRASGFDERLVLIGDERSLPYERPGLSKKYLRGEEPVDESAEVGHAQSLPDGHEDVVPVLPVLRQICRPHLDAVRREQVAEPRAARG